MGEIVLKVKVPLRVPVEAEVVSPDTFAGKTPGEISKMKVYRGNREVELGEIFEVSGEPGATADDTTIVIENSSPKLWRVGEKMTAGKVIAKGPLGHLVGLAMKGGSIEIHGDAGHMLGAMMAGGSIVVRGNAGDLIGAPSRGEKPGRGMKGGSIIIYGNAGAEVGLRMAGGSIIIHGNAGTFPGLYMSGGTVLIKGSCEGKAGARMKGGRVIVCGRLEGGEILPGFYIEGVKETLKVAGEVITGPFLTFAGDVLESPACFGRLFISITANPNLKIYEELLK